VIFFCLEIIGCSVSLRSLESLWRAIRKEHFQLAVIFTESIRVFHILDSLQGDIVAKIEGKMLQKILLNHFEDAVFSEDRITVNIAQVSLISPPISFLFIKSIGTSPT